MDKKIIDKIIELSKENGFLKKENEILRQDNKILNEKINSQKELNDFVETIDQLFNINNKEISKKAKILEQEEKKSENEHKDELTPKAIVMGAVKKGLFGKK